MKLNMACSAQPGHKEFVRKESGIRPTVLSSKRFEGILSRSRQDERREVLAAVEEEQRYKQYLRDGSDALCECFTNVHNHQVTDEDTLQKTRDEQLIERTKDQRAKQLLDEQRKERIMRANQILHLMKPGPRALHHALQQSETIKQRKYNDAINAEIAQDALRQRRLEDQQCPEVLIPFGQNTEEQEKAEQKEKSLSMRAYFLQDLEERRQRKLDAREQEIYESIVEREQYKCLQEKEDKAAKELAVSKREFCRNAYKDALKEKAEKAKFENICEQIDNRIRCVTQVAQRNLQGRYSKQILEMRDNQIRNRESKAAQLGQLQQEKKLQEEQRRADREEVYEAEVEVHEMGRKCRQEELSRQRRAYELDERKLEAEKKQRNAEIRRYEIATRYRNAEANKRFFNAEKERQMKVTKDLREALCGQRQQFLQQHKDELLRTAACQDDPNLKDDLAFFEEATGVIKESQEMGRPLYPLAKVVSDYKRDNQVGIMPERQMIRRNTTRDTCWPGYLSKADLAYEKYEHREKCRQENAKQHNKIFDDCLKITNMASAERPFKPCVQTGLTKCLRYKDMPTLESVKSFEIQNQTNTQSAENPDIKSVDFIEIPRDTKTQPQDIESTLSTTSKRGLGGSDHLPELKRDGISRSLIGVVSTKHKRSSRFADAKNKDSTTKNHFNMENLDTFETPNETEKNIDPTTLKKKESTLSTAFKTGSKNLDLLPGYKRDGISRSFIGVASTKQKSVDSRRGSGDADIFSRSSAGPKRSTMLPNVTNNLTSKKHGFRNESTGSYRSGRGSGSAVIQRSSTNLKRLTKLPDLKLYFSSKPQTLRKESARSAGSRRGSGGADPKRSPKLPDLNRYLTSKPHFLHKTLKRSALPKKSYGVADLLAPDIGSDRVSTGQKRAQKLPDLTQYWTPKLLALQNTDANQGQTNVLRSQDSDRRANKSNTKFTWKAV
ncbi:trichohyalin-like [Drosophila innubila]|uniref:trichohyalin-like n=1 Tax=Drosophila innubila TaxID=198719 RepID=UPI00148DA156|nr:trichohyalin-like [Drosophila innubila]